MLRFIIFMHLPPPICIFLLILVAKYINVLSMTCVIASVASV